MIVNSSLTVYHKGFDKVKRLETWTRYNYENVWFKGGKGSSTNKGYENANNVQVRIPYDVNSNLNINNFSIGDILVQDTLNLDIKTQQDLKDYEIYNITSKVDNNFGTQKHVHLSGK